MTYSKSSVKSRIIAKATLVVILATLLPIPVLGQASAAWDAERFGAQARAAIETPTIITAKPGSAVSVKPGYVEPVPQITSARLASDLWFQCLVLDAKSLDDHISDAATIADALRGLCGSEQAALDLAFNYENRNLPIGVRTASMHISGNIEATQRLRAVLVERGQFAEKQPAPPRLTTPPKKP